MDDNNRNEPVIIGTLRKEKTSKPIFVFILFAALIGVVLSLPFLNDVLKHPDGLKSIFQKEEMEPLPVEEEPYVNPYTKLDENSKISRQNLTVSNFIIEDTLKFTINNPSLILLDNTDLYFNLYDSSGDLVQMIKLVSKEESKLYEINIDADDLYGDIEVFSDYDDINIDQLTCLRETDEYVYYFNEKKLVNLTHKFTSPLNEELLLKKEEEKNKINSSYQDISTINIFEDRFEMINQIDLKEVTTYLDDNYYSSDISSSKIDFDMKLKGYSCT